MQRSSAGGLAALCCAATLLAAPAEITAQPAQRARVDLQLILAIDASGSVNQERFELQMRGHAAALLSRQVLEAIRSGPSQAIAITMVQWTGPTLHVQVVPWMRISDEDSAAALADLISAAPRRLFGGGTSISGAIDYAMTLVASNLSCCEHASYRLPCILRLIAV